MESDSIALSDGRTANVGKPASADVTATRIKRSRVVNLLNRLHFRDREIFLSFVDHDDPGFPLTVPARPQPCDGWELQCRWAEGEGAGEGLRPIPGRHDLAGFYLSDGLERLFVPATLASWTAEGLVLALPSEAIVVGSRRVRRHRCLGVEAILDRDGETVRGELTSFSASSLAVRIERGLPFDRTAGPFQVELRREGEIAFAGPCALLDDRGSSRRRLLVLEPAAAGISRFKPKRVRTDRQKPTPLPMITFRHPLTERIVSLRAIDVSGAGFAVEEDARHAVLFPGLMIPEARIEFMAGAFVTCRAQVLHMSAHPDGGTKVGFAILDMDPGDHVRLCSALHRVGDRHATICGSYVDLDALWDFFFEAGFLYPAKYASLQGQKADFKRLYEKLYHRAPSISRHVIYLDRGVIYGHVSMFRFHQRTWFLHHHAAISSAKHKAGIVVMERILRYINEFHHLPSARMRYIAVYFRPDNRFANRVFGVTTRAMRDRSRNSLDSFAYLHVAADGEAALPAGWTLDPARDADLEAFARCYRERSGGLLVQGLDLDPAGAAADEGLNREYDEVGLTRERKLFALRDGGAGPVALLAANRSDFGLNLSDLTNCIHCLVLAPERLDGDTIRAALRRVALCYPAGAAPALVYPREHADAVGLPYEKSYELTILDMEHFGSYLEIFARYTASRSMGTRPPRGKP